jgi:hypothetical protein
VFPSFYEGLGLPILESYAAGTPVLGADNSAIRELVLPELLFSAACPNSMVAALERLRDDPGLRNRSLAFGTRILGRIGWPAAAERIAAHLRSAESLPARPGPARVAVVADPGPGEDAVDELVDSWAAECDTDLFLPTASRTTPHWKAQIYPIEIARAVVTPDRYRRAVFILGAAADTVDQLLAVRIGSNVERWVYVAGPSPTCLLATSLSGWCPDLASALRWLLEKGEIAGFLVDEIACRDLLVAALGGMAADVRIEVRRSVAAAAAA